MFGLIIGVVTAVAFPIVAVMVHQSRDRMRNRRAGRRRTDKIRL